MQIAATVFIFPLGLYMVLKRMNISMTSWMLTKNIKVIQPGDSVQTQPLPNITL